MTAAIEYNPHCKRCNGTGCVYGVLYDPPEQCDCMRDYQPEEDFSLSPKEKDAALKQLQYERKMEAEERAAEQAREDFAAEVNEKVERKVNEWLGGA